MFWLLVFIIEKLVTVFGWAVNKADTSASLILPLNRHHLDRLGFQQPFDMATVHPTDTMRAYRAQRDSTRRPVHARYNILGFISSGTYGRVYKAMCKENGELYAIKKFKPDKEGEVITYTGISQSACREIAVSSTTAHHAPPVFDHPPSL